MLRATPPLKPKATSLATDEAKLLRLVLPVSRPLIESLLMPASLPSLLASKSMTTLPEAVRGSSPRAIEPADRYRLPLMFGLPTASGVATGVYGIAPWSDPPAENVPSGETNWVNSAGSLGSIATVKPAPGVETLMCEPYETLAPTADET